MWVNIFNPEEKEGQTIKSFLPEDVSSPSRLNTKAKEIKILQGQQGLSKKKIITDSFFCTALYDVAPWRITQEKLKQLFSGIESNIAMLVWRSVQNNSPGFSVAQIYKVGGCSWMLWIPGRSICFSSSLTPLMARQYFPTVWKDRRHPLMSNDFGSFMRCRSCLISLMYYIGTSFQRHSDFLGNGYTKTWR